MDLAALLAHYKGADALASLVCIVDDVVAMRVLTLWPNVPKTWSAPEGQPPDDENARWAWLWSGCSFSAEDYALMAELGTSTLERKLARIKAARLVFPDGTVDSNADAFVRTYIKKEMR